MIVSRTVIDLRLLNINSFNTLTSNKIQEHSEYKRVTKTKSDYRKGQLVDTSPSTSGLRNDHTY